MAKRGKKHLTALQLMREIAKKVGGKKVTNLRKIDDDIGWEEWGDADTVAGFVAGNVTIVVADFYTEPRYTDYVYEPGYHRMNVGVFGTTDPKKASKKNNIDREADTDEETILTWARDAMKGEFEDNPVHQLRVTASTEAKAKTKARKFGRIIDVRHQGGDQYMVKVHQTNPEPWLPSERKAQWPTLSDTELRAEVSELREEIRLNKAAIKRLGKRPTLQQMIAHGVPQELWEENELIQREIDRIKAVLEARKAKRRAKREAKRPLKTPVMRRRKGVVTRINNPKRVKNVRGLVRKALS